MINVSEHAMRILSAVNGASTRSISELPFDIRADVMASLRARYTEMDRSKGGSPMPWNNNKFSLILIRCILWKNEIGQKKPIIELQPSDVTMVSNDWNQWISY